MCSCSPGLKETSEDGAATFWSLGSLMHSIKSFSAKEINKLDGTAGEFWEQERFDRYVRGDRDLEEKFRYIAENPERAALVAPGEEYPWLWISGGDASCETRGRGGRDAHPTRIITDARSRSGARTGFPG